MRQRNIPGKRLTRVFVALVLVLLFVNIPLLPAQSALKGFTLIGDPGSQNGATWTYKDTVGGTVYDLTGILFKPSGSGPFPAVITSHGSGGNALAFSALAKVMVRWGLVCIGPNYTHAGGVPVGLPGSSNQPGASSANILRAHKCWEILASLGYVDMKRVAAHGHSMGAFVTAALVGTYPNDFRVASHTAGGVNDSKTAYTKESQAQGIIAPYQMHHGDQDAVVPLATEQRLDSILQTRGIVHQLYVYPGYGHNDVKLDTTMFNRVRAWYTAYGLFDTLSTAVDDMSQASVPGTFFLSQNYPNPFNPETHIDYNVGRPARVVIQVYDLSGRLVQTLIDQPQPAGRYSITWNGRNISGRDVASGVYLVRMMASSFQATRKIELIK